MNTSESIVNIMPSLLKAQSVMGVASKGKANPFYKSTYADLPEVIETVKEPLNSNKIVVLQPVFGDRVKTVLVHETGEWISDEGVQILCKEANNPQAQGSAITYARRYGLMSLLNVPAVDDDGNAASGKQEKKPAKEISQTSGGDVRPPKDQCPFKSTHSTLLVRTVNKEGEHFGKKYRKCGKCDFFEWVPESQA